MQKLMAALGTSVPEGILGPRLRDLAREGGLAFAHPGGWTDAYRSRKRYAPIWRTAQELGVLPTVTADKRRLRDFADGAVVNLGTDKPPFKTTWNARAPDYARNWALSDGSVDKLREAELLHGFIPKTESLRRFTRSVSLSPARQAALKQKLDAAYPEGWLIKSRGYIGQMTSDMPTDLAAAGKWPVLDGQAADWIVQSRQDIGRFAQPQAQVERWLSKRFGARPHGTHEYRVHVLNGRVVPYATKHKGGPAQGFLERWMPWNTARINQAEALTQRAANQLGRGDRNKTFYAFDIGFTNRGKPFVIEANPSATDGMSGEFADPHVQDAIAAAIKGQLPNYVKARRGLWAGGTGLGVYQAFKPEDDTRPAWQRWMGKQSSRRGGWLGAFPEYVGLLEYVGRPGLYKSGGMVTSALAGMLAGRGVDVAATKLLRPLVPGWNSWMHRMGLEAGLTGGTRAFLPNTRRALGAISGGGTGVVDYELGNQIGSEVRGRYLKSPGLVARDTASRLTADRYLQALRTNKVPGLARREAQLLRRSAPSFVRSIAAGEVSMTGLTGENLTSPLLRHARAAYQHTAPELLAQDVTQWTRWLPKRFRPDPATTGMRMQQHLSKLTGPDRPWRQAIAGPAVSGGLGGLGGLAENLGQELISGSMAGPIIPSVIASAAGHLPNTAVNNVLTAGAAAGASNTLQALKYKLMLTGHQQPRPLGWGARLLDATFEPTASEFIRAGQDLRRLQDSSRRLSATRQPVQARLQAHSNVGQGLQADARQLQQAWFNR